MVDSPWDICERAKAAGRAFMLQFPGDSDVAKAHRSIAAYEWFVKLTCHFKRADVLLMMDPNKNGGGPKRSTMFGVSERHIRRVETIRRSKRAARLEEIAKQGTVSLETIEHLVLHPSTDLVEVVWLILDGGNGTQKVG